MLKSRKIMMIMLINFMFVGILYSQTNSDLEFIERNVATGKIDTALKFLKKVEERKLTLPDKAKYYYLLAQCCDSSNDEDKAYNYYLKAKNIYLKLNAIKNVMEINLDLSYLLYAQEGFNSDFNKYVTEYLNYAKKINNNAMIIKAYSRIALVKMQQENHEESLRNFKIAMNIANQVNDKHSISTLNNNIAALYNEKLNKPDSALYFLKKDIPYLTEVKDYQNICYNYINQAAANYYLEKYNTAIGLLNKADSIPLKKYNVKTKKYIYESFYINYEALRNYKKAFDYLILYKQYNDSVNILEQNIAISDIQTKYNVTEKELQNKVLKTNIKTNRIFLYTSLGLTLATLIIGFLIVKNARKREKISRQEKLIEEQKLEKALKDYELSSIDLMLEGQEKERERIANDLHDNLGSMLATLKMNFEHLKMRKNELADEENKLYDRTDELIEEAYQKVRRLAHAKNAGVLANEGLLPAIKKLAEKLTIPGKLKMQVIDFGFDSRLENKLEIAIFRMIQELATNVIKHSEATEATIHLTHHEDNINIIIEDNGKGFKPDNLPDDGMGLHSIRKKVSQLNGQLEVDSTPGKGTTIIIDLPV